MGMISIQQFEEYLILEKSPATREKYLRDVNTFLLFLSGREVSKALVWQWKEELRERLAVRSVNAMLASVKCFLKFLGREDCRVKRLRFQRAVYCPEDRELTKGEYQRPVEK